MPTEKLTLDINYAVELYERGISLKEVAGQLGVSRSTIVRRMKEVGLKPRAHGATYSLGVTSRYGDLSELVKRYVAGESLKTISDESGINRRQIERAIVSSGHKLRSLLQAQGLRYTKLTADEKRALTVGANVAKRGREASNGSLERRAKTLEATLQMASRADLMLGVWISQRGWVFTPQKAIGRYNIDIAFEELCVAVEVNGSWHRFPEKADADVIRREFLLNRGWRIIDVELFSTQNAPWKYLRPACADKIISMLEAFRRDKSTLAQHTVIRGDGEFSPRCETNDGDFPAVA